MERGGGVGEGIEGLVARAVSFGPPGPDGPALVVAGDHALGGELTEVLGIEAAREVDGAGAGFGEPEAGEERVLDRIDAHDEQRDPALVGTGGPTRPDRHAGAAAALDRPDAAGEPGAAELVGRLAQLQQYPPDLRVAGSAKSLELRDTERRFLAFGKSVVKTFSYFGLT